MTFARFRRIFGNQPGIQITQAAQKVSDTFLAVWVGLAVAGVMSCGGGSAALAEVFRVGPEEDWFAVLSSGELQPGDEVVLRGGIYTDARRLLIRHRGTAERPIVIRGAEGEQAIFRRPDARQNTLDLEGAQHLHLRSFEITGGAAGIRIRPRGDDPVRGIVLEELHLHHLGGVAVTCNDPGGVYERMVFRRNHIHHTSGHGEAFYLGGNNASAILKDSLVELNYIHDLRGEDVSQGDGVELKHGSYGNQVIGNVIHDTGYPGVIVYGTVGKPRNIIANNLIWNTGDHGIQAAADAIIRNNFIAGAGGVGIHCRDHQEAVTGNLTIQENVVIDSRAEALRIQRPTSPAGGGDYSGPIAIAGNTLVGTEGVDVVRVDSGRQLTFSENVGIGRLEGIRPASDDWRPPLKNEFVLPKLEGNPAWKHLDRAAVQARFSL